MSHITIVSMSNNKWSVNNVVPACRGCLEIDTKLIPLEGRTGEVFYKFTGIPLTDGLRYLCFMCLEMLNKFDNFRKRCRSAMLSIRKIECLRPVTPSDIRKIDRSQYNYLLNRTPIELLIIDPPQTQAQQSETSQNNLENQAVESFQHSYLKNLLSRQVNRKVGNRRARQRMTKYNTTFEMPNLVDHTQVTGVPQTSETETQIDFITKHPLLSLCQLTDKYNVNSPNEINTDAEAAAPKFIKILPKPSSLVHPMNILPEPSTVVHPINILPEPSTVVHPINILPEPSTVVHPINILPESSTVVHPINILPEPSTVVQSTKVITETNEEEVAENQNEEIMTDIKVENELDDVIVKEENLLIPVDDEDEDMEDNNGDNIMLNESSKENKYTKENEHTKEVVNVKKSNNIKEVINAKESNNTQEDEKSLTTEIIDEDLSSSSSSSDSDSSSSSDDESDSGGATAMSEPEVQIDLTSDDEIIRKENDKIGEKAQEKPPVTDSKLSNFGTAKQDNLNVSEEDIKDKLLTAVSMASNISEDDINSVKEQEENETLIREVTLALQQKEDKKTEVIEKQLNKVEQQHVNKSIDKVILKVTESMELEDHKVESQPVSKEIEQQGTMKRQELHVTEESNVEAIEKENNQEKQQINEALAQELNNALKEIIPVDVVQEEIRTAYKISEPENFVSNPENIIAEITSNKIVVKVENEETFDVEEFIFSEEVDAKENEGETSGHIEEAARINILQSALLSAGIDETDLHSTPQKRSYEYDSDSDCSDTPTDLPDCLMGIDSEIYKNDRPLIIAKSKPAKLNTVDVNKGVIKQVKEPRGKRKSRRIAEKDKKGEKERNLDKEAYDVWIMERKTERKKLKKEVKHLRAIYRAKVQTFLSANRGMRKLEKKLRSDMTGGVRKRLAQRREYIKNIRLELRTIKDEYLKKKTEEILMSSDED